MRQQPPDYLSYMLRMWATRRGQKALWRASLESPLTGEQWTFTSLEEAWAFLQSQIEAGRDVEPAPHTDSRGGKLCAL